MIGNDTAPLYQGAIRGSLHPNFSPYFSEANDPIDHTISIPTPRRGWHGICVIDRIVSPCFCGGKLGVE